MGTAARSQPIGGSRKGRPNKSTANAREAIARFVDGNADRLNEWLTLIEAKDGPKAAFNCFTDLLEYHVPKLARHEHTGKDGGPVVIQAGPLDERL
jgi:hypothetical protein